MTRMLAGMIRWLLCLSLLSFALPAAARPGVQVTVARAKAGEWLVDYAFTTRSRAWIFQRTAADIDGKPWRQQSWTVETPGVRLVHAGAHDVLAGDKPLSRVRIRMRPFLKPLMGDYSPALAFSDGGIAFYSDHFVVGPITSVAAAAALPADLNDAGLLQPDQTLTLSDPGGKLLLRGKALIGRASLSIGDGGTYVYAGPAPVTQTPAFAGVIDAGLPPWARGELDGFTPRLMRLYTERLGTPVGGRPMALVAWQGSSQRGYSLGGSVLANMVVMQISGANVLSREPRVLDELRWFLGHESSHFWLGQTIRYTRRSESWMTEGGADLLAIRAIQELAPGYDPLVKLQQELDECLTRIGPNAPLAGAEDRGQMRAHYACGALLMLVAEARAKKRGGDLFGFIRGLIGKAQKGEVSRETWLSAFAEAGGDLASVEAIRTFIVKGVPDPRGFWMKRFDASGIRYRLVGDRITFI